MMWLSMIEPIAFLIVGLFGTGMAAAFFVTDRQSPSSRALSLFWALLGLTWLMNIPGQAYASDAALKPWGIRFFSTQEALVLTAGLEWGWRVIRTQSAAAEPGIKWIRVAQGLALLYGIIGLIFGELQSEVWKVVWHVGLLSRPGFYLFAVPWFAALALPIVPVLRMRRAVDLDPAEASRVIALVAAAPFLISGMAVPMRWKPIGFAIGEVIFLLGALRYHVLQGQRGQFLARFVSPDLARLVQDRGLAIAMQRSRVELSAVACDLRGFTAFAETGAPEEVMKLLEDYYSAVGEVVSEFGGSIKDFAGDGILALVGAPIAYPDHARRALGMALRIRDRGSELLAHWQKLGLELGLGVGVASGFATVGAIGGTGRLEYGAVGPVVNLASRLASRAEAGQVLAEPRVVGLAASDNGPYRFQKLDAEELKGFARPVTLFTVESPQDADRMQP